MDKENDVESIVFNNQQNQQPPETMAIEEETESDAGSMTNGDYMMLPESNDTDHMLGNAENQDNTEEEAIEHEEREMSKERVTIDEINIMMQMNTSQLELHEQEQLTANMLKGIEYNSSTKGKCASDINEIVSTNCESEKWNTEVEKDKKVSFDNVTNAG